MKQFSITGNFMSKYGGVMFINKQEAINMDIQSLSLFEMEIYISRIAKFITRKSTRKFEKKLLQDKMSETTKFIYEIYGELIELKKQQTTN